MNKESPYLLEIKKNNLKDFDWRSEVHDQHVSKYSPSFTDSVNDSLSDLVSIKIKRLENFKNLIIGHLNINSISNKFEIMADIINSFSIFLITKSKLESSFSSLQFKINAYESFNMIGTSTVGVFFYM